MPYFQQHLYGVGTVFVMDSTDDYAFIPQGVDIVAVGPDAIAIMTLPPAEPFIWVHGNIASTGTGIEMQANFAGTIAVGPTGTIVAENIAIHMVGQSASTVISNSGLIESISGHAIYLDSEAFGGGPVTVTNSGIIRAAYGRSAIDLGDGNNRIINTGTIIGDIYTYHGNDVVDLRAGTFIGEVNLGQGDDTYYLKGDEAIDDQGGNDTIYVLRDFELGADFENLTLLGNAIRGTGNDADNTLNGNARNNLLEGGAGHDIIDGRGGADRIFGGDGDDYLYLSGGVDTVNGGAGDDWLDVPYGAASGVTINLTTGLIRGGGSDGDRIISIERVASTEWGDTLTGTEGANIFRGYEGSDVLMGMGGDDELDGGDGADKLNGGAGIDTVSYLTEWFDGVTVNLATGANSHGDTYFSIENVIGTDNADILTGSDVSNVLTGGYGADVIDGGSGNDVIDGGFGDDRMTGGARGDRFVFSTVSGSDGWGVDTITDFTNAADKIDFSGEWRVNGMSDLVLTQDGADAVITVGLDSIRLFNFTIANLDASDFIFAA